MMRASRSTIQSRRGFTLVEILLALAILLIFFAAAGEVFKSSVLISYDSQEFSDRTSRIDSAAFQLRRDVWNSREIATPSGQSADLVSGDGSKIIWQIDSDNRLIRTDSQGHLERWDAIGKNWSLSNDGISLTIADATRGDTAEMRLPSEILLAERGHP